MFPRTVVLAAAFATCVGISQVSYDIGREASHLDELVNGGKYLEAAKLGKSLLDRLHIWQQDDQALVFLAYLGKASVEQGQPRLAFKLFDSADAINARTWNRYYEPALLREKAALSYAAGEYVAAADLAARAYRTSIDHNYYRVRAEYCHSLEALALLRMGRLAEAERLASIAAKAVPKKTTNRPVFAPRILYAACVVAAHSGNLVDAEAFCRRGLDDALSSGSETRDLSLGYLAFAEFWLQAGDLAQSRESALRAVDLTKKMFGTHHQDMVEALTILALVNAKSGDVDAARCRVDEAARIAAAMFGIGSTAAALPARTLAAQGQNQR